MYVRRLEASHRNNNDGDSTAGADSLLCVCVKIAQLPLFSADELADGAPPGADSKRSSPTKVSSRQSPDKPQPIAALTQLARTPLDKFAVDQLWVNLMPVVNAFEELIQEFIGICPLMRWL